MPKLNEDGHGTAAAHYMEAQNWLEGAKELLDNGQTEAADRSLRIAQVHATLACIPVSDAI